MLRTSERGKRRSGEKQELETHRINLSRDHRSGGIVLGQSHLPTEWWGKNDTEAGRGVSDTAKECPRRGKKKIHQQTELSGKERDKGTREKISGVLT